VRPCERRIDAELLDLLPAGDPSAMKSRRDLKLLNVIMRNTHILAERIRQHWQGRIATLVDLGAGDGTACLAVARRLAPLWPDVSLTLLDRQELVSRSTTEEFERLGWRAEIVVSDVSDYLRASHDRPVDIILANLFLHHFHDRRLIDLLHLISSKARLFVAVEPRRCWRSLAASRCVGMIGCNRVTRHDALASARAGFSGMELTHLWPSRGGWTLHESRAGLFSHSFTALRHG
jgi:Methyltransferase domain